MSTARDGKRVTARGWGFFGRPEMLYLPRSTAEAAFADFERAKSDSDFRDAITLGRPFKPSVSRIELVDGQWRREL